MELITFYRFDSSPFNSFRFSFNFMWAEREFLPILDSGRTVKSKCKVYFKYSFFYRLLSIVIFSNQVDFFSSYYYSVGTFQNTRYTQMDCAATDQEVSNAEQCCGNTTNWHVI